jgi:hypothetical protein
MRRLSTIALAAGMIFTQPATTTAAADEPSAEHSQRRTQRRRGGAARGPRRQMRDHDSPEVRRSGDAADPRPKPPDPGGQPMEELIVPEEYRYDDPRAKRPPPPRRTRVRKGRPDIRNP